ncbi:hypothetical protein Moror_10528 [Moniliophthora roreri MCA 2997]|uniref:Uncharacterized protein n=1 Tax=Moniliophthora roreri (strain MCA 2997) TaxID=1381753 RepID=V2XDK6_MONRO|nr:hypothetical protein Moror_10528 [Moniliophthora roreri MCA 2997]
MAHTQLNLHHSTCSTLGIGTDRTRIGGSGVRPSIPNAGFTRLCTHSIIDYGHCRRILITVSVLIIRAVTDPSACSPVSPTPLNASYREASRRWEAVSVGVDKEG